jgi:uncharacterized protein DUF5335
MNPDSRDAERGKREAGEAGGGAGGKEEVGEPQPQAADLPCEVEIAHNDWIPFLDSFSRQHKNWIVNVEVIGREGRLMIVADRPLDGVSVDRADDHERAYVQVQLSAAEHTTHTIGKPVQMTFKQTKSGAHEGLEIASADGTTTAIHFRAASSPEMVDGLAA